MSNYNTITSLKTIQGKTFRKVVTGASTVEDIPTIIADYEKQIAGIEGASMEVKDGRIDFSNGQFVMLPKLKREAIGKLTVRPTGDYFFVDDETGTPSYGVILKKSNTTFVEGGFAVKYENGAVMTFTEV